MVTRRCRDTDLKGLDAVGSLLAGWPMTEAPVDSDSHFDRYGGVFTNERSSSLTIQNDFCLVEQPKYVGTSCLLALPRGQRTYLDYWKSRDVDVTPFFAVLDGPRIPAPGGAGFPAPYQALQPYFNEMFWAVAIPPPRWHRLRWRPTPPPQSPRRRQITRARNLARCQASSPCGPPMY
jgi:hypothetical protein